MSSIGNLLSENSRHFDIFNAVGEMGVSSNNPTFLVGGYVRDLLMGKTGNDIDILVENDGIGFAQKLSKKLKAEGFVAYEKFGTAQIILDDLKVEIATARTETYSSDSRNPKVVFTNINEDLSRRDFTVNAIAVSILPDSFGEVCDPFGGIKDLKRQTLITPLDPDVTFSDDPLRMLRAVRFAAQLEFKIDHTVMDSIIRQRKRMEIITKERITDEIKKLLSTNTPSIGFYHLKDTQLLEQVFPELTRMYGVEVKNGKGHKDVFVHTLQVVDNAAELTNKMEIRFAALVHDIAKPNTKRFNQKKGWTFHGHEEIGKRMLGKIAKRMKLSNELRDYLMVMTKLHLRPIALAKGGITDSAIRRLMFEAGENIEELMILCRADITTKNPKKIKKYMHNFEKVEELMKDLKLRDEMQKFQSPVRGDVIMKDLKLDPGPSVGKIKSAIENAILDGIIPNEYEPAYKYMISIKDEIISPK